MNTDVASTVESRLLEALRQRNSKEIGTYEEIIRHYSMCLQDRERLEAQIYEVKAKQAELVNCMNDAPVTPSRTPAGSVRRSSGIQEVQGIYEESDEQLEITILNHELWKVMLDSI